MAPPVRGDLLPGNIWPNVTLEMDSNHDGVPDFWHRGGTAPAIAVWSTARSVSTNHSFQLNDLSTGNWGEWYSELLEIEAGANYQCRYHLWYHLTNIGPMRVSVNFHDSGGDLLSGISYTFSGKHEFWEEMTHQFAAPANATRLRLTFTSGGGVEVTGTAWVDDISLAATATQNSLVPYVESFPLSPSPLLIRDWKQTAQEYHQLVFDPGATGPFLPLLYEYAANTAAGYLGPAFGLPSYIGGPRNGGEALTALGAVLGGTLAGLNMASLDGQDRVGQCEAFYCVVNGHGLVLNNVNSQGSGSAWYDIFPSTLFYRIGSRYPNRPSFENRMRAIADSWLAALTVLSNNWEHTGFSFTTMRPTDMGWSEPDLATGIAWLEYMAFARFGEAKYLAAADTCMAQMNTRSANPFYETLGLCGPALSARMNAELGRSYSTSKHLNWVFSSGSDARPGWGCQSGRWGSYDCHGLFGSTTDSSGYAFSMNSFVAAGHIAPTVRYEPQYARLLGRWLLHVAANARLFYPDALETNMQSSAAWVQQTAVRSISYEGLRNLGITTPYATGDAAEPMQDLNPYGAWGSGYMAALFQTSSVPGILRINCVATEAFPPAAHPTFLYYNPYALAQQVAVEVGPDARHLYDAVAGAFVKTNVGGIVNVSIAPDTAVVLVHCPATAIVTHTGNQLLCDGTVIDYQNAALDTDRDGLPDWWESRYYGGTTNASAQAPTANGLNNLHSCWLGLDPGNAGSTFEARSARQLLSGYPLITWSSVGGKTYAVEYADRLDAPGNRFTQAVALTETNVPAGTESTSLFVDDFSLTGGPPGTNGRYYRVRWLGP